MISVEEAWRRILKGVKPLKTKEVPLDQALGRTLALDIKAKCSTPSHDISAMDGYALKHSDLKKTPASLSIIGEAPAGKPFNGAVKLGQAVRIFTGGIVPKGADTVIIQENTKKEGKIVLVQTPAPIGKNIRKAGMDFKKNAQLVKAGTPLNERDLALISAGNHRKVPVYRKPKVALFANGDELVTPGGNLKPGKVINSNTPMLKGLIESQGGELLHSEIISDNPKAIQKALTKGAKADIIVTLGGASVGDYDYVQDAIKAAGGTINFWKIAMKPGKPLMFGSLKGTPILGLPGNPNSAYVTAFLYLLPLLCALLGKKKPKPKAVPGKSGGSAPATQDRETFILSKLSIDPKTGGFVATPHPVQDSARISTLQASQALIIRKPFSPALKKGGKISIFFLPGF